jgi:uncharacterized membrane protein
VSTYQWLLGFHVTGAFLLLGGSVLAAVFNVLAHRRERPSEITLFFGLIRIGEVAIYAGALLTIVLGLWLVHHVGYSYSSGWIIASVVLWFVGMGLGGAGGSRFARAKELAQRLAREGDAPSAELDALVRDRTANVLSWASGAAMLLVLLLMIWKPGA